VVKYREVPPGLMGPLFGVSAWLAAITWIVGVVHDQVFGTNSGLVGAWPTLIFGIPALVTGWLLSRATQATVRVISIPSFLVLVWLAANAAALITIVALKSAGIETPPWNLDIPFIGVQKVTHPTWVLMMFLTGFNTLIAGSMLLTKSSRYASVINGES
jgi:hypothetical protein